MTSPRASSDALPPFQITGEGLKIAVRVTPKAARPGLAGVVRDGEGRAYLSVRLGEPADKGRANAALRRFLAKQLRVPQAALALLRGETARTKLLLASGDGEALAARLQALLGAASNSSGETR